MNVAKKISEVGNFVKHYLENEPKMNMYRDNDEALLARYWSDQLCRLGYKPKTTTALAFLILLAEGKITQSDIILRARRKMQEKHPELRGAKWADRHKEAKDVKKEITQYDTKRFARLA